jgi:hypothetical protein
MSVERDEEAEPVVPEYHMTDEEVEHSEIDYSDRAADDYVAVRKFDQFPSPDRARAWAVARWGARLRSVTVDPHSEAWIFVIRRAT